MLEYLNSKANLNKIEITIEIIKKFYDFLQKVVKVRWKIFLKLSCKFRETGIKLSQHCLP